MQVTGRKSKDMKNQVQIEDVDSDILNEDDKLENGVDINLGQEIIHLKGSIIAVLADNLGSHEIANNTNMFDKYEKRTKAFYCRDVNETINKKQACRGVKANSYLNSLQHYHVCDSGLPPCIAHDWLEGVLQSDLSLALNGLDGSKIITYDEINLFGPLRFLWTLKFESKHQYFKFVVRHTNNYKNVLLSLSHKHQLLQALLSSQESLFSNKVIADDAEIFDKSNLQDSWAKLVQRHLGDSKCLLSKRIDFRGICYKSGMVVCYDRSPFCGFFLCRINVLVISEQYDNVCFVGNKIEVVYNEENDLYHELGNEDSINAEEIFVEYNSLLSPRHFCSLEQEQTKKGIGDHKRTKQYLFAFNRKASAKLQIDGERLALNSDETIIDEDEILILMKEEILILLEKHENWVAKEKSIFNTDSSLASTITVLSTPSEDENSDIQSDKQAYTSVINMEMIIEKNTEYLWSTWTIPWDKISPSVIDVCSSGQKDYSVITDICHLVINEMRLIHSLIPANIKHLGE
ncbi:hypothetical protein ILUMI_03830 [Ignelater luminosus]|uniref:Uncharacterized protein n=1 Tax=Ignelater luminosus TaxID=2038154 RepID=A0A8K0GLS6_IGNLU|nr:hypothetical protein ILUMI_03830 [Ignelater luminosus]